MGEATRSAEQITPKRKFTVYLVPHNHLDIGFTDYQPKIEELQNRNLDRLLEEMRHDGDLRFSLDGVWLVEQYLRTRSPAAQKEFLEAVRAGRISIPAQYANLMAGGAGTGDADPLHLRRPRDQSRSGHAKRLRQYYRRAGLSLELRIRAGRRRQSSTSPRAPTTTAVRSRSTAGGRPVRPFGGRARMAQKC